MTFHNDVYELLLENETKNLVLLGDLSMGLSEENPTGWRDPSKWVMASMKRDGHTVLAALMLPEDKLQIYAEENFECKDLALFVAGLEDANISVPGVNAEYALAEAFAQIYSSSNNIKYSIAKKGRIYSLEHISKEVCSKSQIRLAQSEDLAFLPFWWSCFFDSLHVADDLSAFEKLIRTKTLYILEDGGIPVSMARIDQKLERVCGLGMIYTPPYFRSRGFATKISASLSTLCLERGYIPALTTDLANLVSNKIYQKIGYKEVCDTLEVDFIR